MNDSSPPSGGLESFRPDSLGGVRSFPRGLQRLRQESASCCLTAPFRNPRDLWPVLKELVVYPPKTRRVPAVDLLEEALRIAANVRTAREMAVPH